MAGSAAKRFRAVLEPLEGGMGWVIARLPFDVQTTWKNMVRLRVKVEVGGEVFRTSLFADSHRGGHFLLVNKKMQKAAAARVGAMVDFTIAPDLEERSPAMPPELAKLLKTEKALAKWFAGLSESTRWEIGKWIEGVKSAGSKAATCRTNGRTPHADNGERKSPPANPRSSIPQNPRRAKGLGGDDPDAATQPSARGLLLPKPRSSREACQKTGRRCATHGGD